jgi:low temperature requirement protein LtrA
VLVVMFARVLPHAGAAHRFARNYLVGDAVGGLIMLSSLLVDPPLRYWVWAVAVLELMAAPVFAVRAYEGQPFDSRHIPERYGLFTIIVLGESVLASSNAISTDFADGGLTLDLALLGVGGLVLLFGMWWVYFLHETGEALRTRRHLDFLWGYSHYAIFASVAAVGAGLEAAIERGLHDVEASARTVGLVLAVAVSVYLVLVALVHGRLSPSHRPSLLHAVVGAVLLVVIALTVASASLPSGVLLFGVVVVGLVVLGSRAGYAGS